MITGNVSVSMSDKTPILKVLLASLTGKAVYVGIPQAETLRSSKTLVAGNASIKARGAGKKLDKLSKAVTRKIGGVGDVTNAQLLFIHTNGSPIRHIPKRPVIEPAIQAHKEEITEELRAACIASLDLIALKPAEATRHLERAGTLGMNAARGWFLDPRNGWSPNAPATILRKKSERPLIDTGQLRRSITYLVRDT